MPAAIPIPFWGLHHRALPLSAQHAARVPGGIVRVIGVTTLAGDVVGWTVVVGGRAVRVDPCDVRPMGRRVALVSETPEGAA